MADPKLKTIIFDLGNVLYDINISLGFNSLHSLVNKDRNFDEWQFIFSPILHKYETGKISTKSFVDFIQQFAKKDTSRTDIITVWNSMLIGMQSSRIELLKKLSTQYDLYLLSNINDLHYKFFIQSLTTDFTIQDFEAQFVQCYYSHKIDLRKPNVEAFEWVIQQNNLNPNHTIFIDDVLENIIAASNVGLQTLHINPETVYDQLSNYFNLE